MAKKSAKMKTENEIELALMVEPAEDALAELALVNGYNAEDQAEDQAEDRAENNAEDRAQDQAEEARYEDLVAAVTEEQVAQTQAALQAAFAERARYEYEQNPANENIQRTIAKVQRGHLAHGISQAITAIGLDPNYVNGSEVSGKRRNVYALEKVQDLLYAAQTGQIKNRINNAILLSMYRCEERGLPFTGAVAKACASDKIAVDPAYRHVLVRHTVAESTASTQASSTMTALEDLNAVVNRGSARHGVWVFADTPIGRRLKAVAKDTLVKMAKA